MPVTLLKELCKIGSLPLESIKIRGTKMENWGARIGGERGIRTLLERYDKDTLNYWRALGGHASPLGGGSIKDIRYPEVNETLSEFIGIYLGDGTLTKNYVRISCDRHYDWPYVSEYVSRLAGGLFNLKPAIYCSGGVVYLRLSSVKLCRYLKQEWNLPFGDKIKNKVEIPAEFMKGDELTNGCIRGLVDTDGSISKDNTSISLRYSSRNPYLLKQFIEIADGAGFLSFSNKREAGTKSLEKIKNYFRRIGSSNLKHIIRFNEKVVNNRLLYVKETINYFKEYANLELPFKGPVV